KTFLYLPSFFLLLGLLTQESMDDPKLDLLVIAVHPDDAELCCGGTIIKHAAAGKRVGIIDLTRGELGTRGTAETRDQEAAAATRLMGLTLRENLRMRD